MTTLAVKPLLLPVTFPRVLLSEWTKLRTLRSTVYTLAAAVIGTIGVAILVCALQAGHYFQETAQQQARFEPIATSLNGVQIAQLALGVLGVLVVSGEYSTGMIRATLTAVPQRLPVLWAKAAVFAVLTFVLMLPSTLIAFFAGQAILNGHHLGVSLSAPQALRSVLGATLYLVVVGLLGIACGALTRTTAGGIAALFGVLLVLPAVLEAFPKSIGNSVGRWLPSTAGHSVWWPKPDTAVLSPWVGFAVFVGYLAVAMAAAALLLKRRDA